MTWLLKIWAWFSGKKTNIGAAILLIAAVFTQLVSIWGVQGAWVKPLIDTLDYLGGLLTGAGLAHKAAKAIDTKTVAPM